MGVRVGAGGVSLAVGLGAPEALAEGVGVLVVVAVGDGVAFGVDVPVGGRVLLGDGSSVADRVGVGTAAKGAATATATVGATAGPAQRMLNAITTERIPCRFLFAYLARCLEC